jgi:hypothetical protein
MDSSELLFFIGKFAVDQASETALKAIFKTYIDQFEGFSERAKERVMLLMHESAILLKDAGVIHRPPDRIFAAVCETVPLIEDDTLRSMWANLYAKAMMPDEVGKVRPAYLRILKDMAPEEALILKLARLNQALGNGLSPETYKLGHLAVSTERLLSEGLLQDFEPNDKNLYAIHEIRISTTGLDFLEVCEAPLPTSKDVDAHRDKLFKQIGELQETLNVSTQ